MAQHCAQREPAGALTEGVGGSNSNHALQYSGVRQRVANPAAHPSHVRVCARKTATVPACTVSTIIVPTIFSPPPNVMSGFRSSHGRKPSGYAISMLLCPSAGWRRSSNTHLDEHLSSNEYLMRRDYSVADAHFFVVSNWASWVNLDLSHHPAVLAHLQRVGSRPAVPLNAEGLVPRWS